MGPPGRGCPRSLVGTVGDGYDNALAKSVIGLFKTELIKLWAGKRLKRKALGPEGLRANRAARLGIHVSVPRTRTGGPARGCAVADCGVWKPVCGFTGAAAGSPFWC
jgi:hypothetical protein